ncbi:PREDICTED: pachytene checkpoint protein 2 homolog isoform X1 [Dinoponera quadriceps]|uniref:Pachytene checkpoint protein 2 homolog n=1 Tax=Dinoponera quadriceps TaxID=609295 RepID=A0A6P3WNR6_DINQU|nr:PREDICTED: pachytene checkpoint protein 2 homolog isoform X1 [Dinoponera quadriceps]
MGCELHLEICQHSYSTLSKEQILEAVNTELSTWLEIYLDTIIYGKDCTNLVLKEHVESMVCSDYSSLEKEKVYIQEAVFKFYIYSLTQEMAATETLQSDSEELSVASHWVLPSIEFHHIWQHLFYDSNIKNDLLHYVETTMLFSDRGVNSNVISWNKVILLHGPPGTGKTSLCKALAQKAVIRMRDYFTHGEFIEINSHSLFSKWFSESGKLVMKLFDEIRNLVQDTKALICILIDEVESLAHARKSCANGTEPSDSIRVVNALLTQLDQIKRYPNVLILTTSNMTEAIDLAFVDRADIKQYLGFPSEVAIYHIYRSCLRELMRTGVLNHKEICDISELKMLGYEETSNTKNSLKLLEICRASVGLTGRALRKMPFLAHALYLSGVSISLSQFLKAMQLVIEKRKRESLQ